VTEPRPRWWSRPLGLVAVLAAVVGLAFLVARPRTDMRTVAVDHTGAKGVHPPGLRIDVRHGEEVRTLVPGTPLRAGDTLRFIPRISAPRYLIVRTRDAGGRQRILFPAAADAGDATAALTVQPGQALPVTFVLDAAPGREVVTALFADRPFRAGDPPGDGIDVVTVDLVKEP
jgi:hypothetical protein